MTVAMPSRAAVRAAFLVRPLRQAPRLEPASPHRRGSRPLAPLEDRQGQAQARHRSDPRDARGPGRLSHRHRPGLRYRRGRDGAVVAARRAAGHRAGLGILRRRLGHRRHQAAQAQGRDRAQGAVTASCPISPRSIGRPTWSSPGTAPRPACACPNADWIAADRAGARHLRRHLGGLRAAARLAQARCRHLLLAEGAGRRGRARHADPVAARGGAARELHAGHGRCRRFSA